MIRVCPDCRKPHSESLDHPGEMLLLACPQCHTRRRAKLRELEARYPSAEELGLEGQQGDFGWTMIQGIQGLARNGRVIRKSEPMGG